MTSVLRGCGYDGSLSSLREWRGIERATEASTLSAYRCIDKAGGLDRYILSQPKSEANSFVAAELRERLLAVQSSQREAMRQLVAGSASDSAVTGPDAALNAAAPETRR